MSENPVKISIIVPVYNVKSYIGQCIESIACQTIRDIEIILVDDGSTDGSGSICDDYAIIDSRIRVVHKTNNGAASARNVGLENAGGKYIGFVDSDDFIEESYFESMYEAMIAGDLDYIMAGSRILCDGNVTRICPVSDLLPKDPGSLVDRDVLIGEVLSKAQFGGVCSKLFKRSIILENRIRFDEDLRFHEDGLFNLEYIFHCNRIDTVDDCGYFYRMRKGSVTSGYDDRYTKLLALAMEKKKNLVKQYQPGNRLLYNYICRGHIRELVYKYFKTLMRTPAPGLLVRFGRLVTIRSELMKIVKEEFQCVNSQKLRMGIQGIRFLHPLFFLPAVYFQLKGKAHG